MVVRCLKSGEFKIFHIDADAGNGDFAAGGVKVLVGFGGSIGERAKDVWERHMEAP